MCVTALLAAGAGYALAVRRDVLLGAAGFGAFLMVTAGVLYPCFGVNRLPDGLARAVGPQRRVYLFNSSRPAFLPVRLNRAVQALTAGESGAEALRRAAAEGAAIAVGEEQREQLHAALAAVGFDAGRSLIEWRAFSTRKTFVQFAREGATADDWREAWRTRDLSGLKGWFAVAADFRPLAPAAGQGEADPRAQEALRAGK